MPPSFQVGATIFAINAIAGIAVAFSWLNALFILVSRENIEQSRLVLARGLVSALSLLTAATLLKTIELKSWISIVSFATVFGMRTLMKAVLQWDIQRLVAQPKQRCDRPA